MSLPRCRNLLMLESLVLAALLLVACPYLSAAEEGKVEGIELGENIKLLFEGKVVPQSGYWIGVGAHAVDEEIAKKLGLNEGEGIVVDEIMPESPAAKARLAKDDVILSVGDKAVGSVEQLAGIIDASEGKEIQLKIQRAGKKSIIEVTPAKRDKIIFREEGGEGKEGEEKAEAKDRLEGLLHQLRERVEKTGEKKPGAGIVYRPNPWQPGAALPAGLPDDMEVTIQKKGNRPARVIVKQGEKTWKTNENELGMLPPQSQGYVNRMLGKPAVGAIGGWPMPGAPLGGEARRFEFRIGEDGKTELVKPKGAGEPQIKVTPEGIRIEIREAGEKEGKAPTKPAIKWQELKRPEPPKESSEQRLHELQKQVEQLKQQLDKIHKADGSTKEKPKQ